jgi:hypothetical protein
MRNPRCATHTSVLLLLLLCFGCIRNERHSGDEFNLTWGDALRKVQIRSSGAIEFTDDERDIKQISGGGYLLVKERRGLTLRQLEIEQRSDGSLHRSYSLRGKPQPFDDEARAWLAQLLSHFIRQTGHNASARVQRILERQGAEAVLNEISAIRSDRVKGIYFLELFHNPALDLRVKQLAIQQVAREISSDGDKASLIERIASNAFQDQTLRHALIESTATVSSDGERARLLSTFLGQSSFEQSDLVPILNSASQISSDGEKSRVLQEAAAHYSGAEATRASFFRVVDSISSDGERRQVLTSFLTKQQLSLTDLIEAAKAAAQISSDGEKASVLEALARHYAHDVAFENAFFQGIDSMSSDGERRRVLRALLSQQPAANTLLRLLDSAAKLSSDGEKGEVLLEIAKLQPRDSDLLSRLIRVTDSLGADGEYRRVMSTLLQQTDLFKVALQRGKAPQ